MNWIQLNATVTPEIAEAFEESIVAAGALAVTLRDAEDNPLFEPELGTTPIWQQTIVTGLFDADEDIDQAMTIAKEVYQHLTRALFPNVHIEILENEDWTRKWIENFKPIRFGSRLWVCPSWCEPPVPGAINLMLDPGLAFGTGTHATTALCLMWLDGAELRGKTIIDYGCGSGILGIAALLLGAKRLIAVDNDPQALIATKDNATRNHLDPELVETYLPEDTPSIEADITLANILAQPLYGLCETLHQLTKIGGDIVLSGILETQAEALNAHYASCFEMEPITEEAGWTRLSGHKK